MTPVALLLFKDLHNLFVVNSTGLYQFHPAVLDDI